MAETVKTLTDENWEAEVIRSDKPVLVDFWAEWCQPCQDVGRSVEAVAHQFEGRLRVGKMDVAMNEDVPVRYNVSTLPTLLLIKGGLVAEQRTGKVPREKIVELVQGHV